MNIQLRLATPEDIPMLKHWDTKPHVIACNPNDQADWKDEFKRNDPAMKIFIAELNGRPIGALMIIDPYKEETHYWGDCEPNMRAIDIWIGEEDELSKGYGTQMMTQALQKCFAPPEVTKVIIDPLANNKRAQKFYERIGFVFVEERTFDKDDCYIYELTRERWETLQKSIQ